MAAAQQKAHHADEKAAVEAGYRRDVEEARLLQVRAALLIHVLPLAGEEGGDKAARFGGVALRDGLP